MKNKELFDKTISILVEAYKNDTLLHSSCRACAVGNIVAASNNRKVIVLNRREADADWSNGMPHWQDVFVTIEGEGQRVNIHNYEGKAKEQIDATGYSWEELAAIESAFESVGIRYRDEDFNSDYHQFEGLMRVVDALMKIHEADEETIKEAKNKFVTA